MSQGIERLEQFLPKSNVTLNYQQIGSGNTTIVLLHGLGSNSEAFRKNIPVLAENAVVYAIDLPGYGNSEIGNLEPGIATYAAVIKEFIQLNDLKNVTLVGHSMGGQIAIQLASCQSDAWLKKLVLLAPAGLEQFTEDEKKWFHSVVNEQLYMSMTDDQIRHNFNINFFGENVPKDAQFMVNERLEIKQDKEKYTTYISTIINSIYAMLAEPVYQKIKDIQVPIKVIYGKNDMLIPNRILHPQLSLKDILEKLKADYPKIAIEQLDEAGHFVLWDRSDEVNSHILDDSNNE